MLCSNGAKGKVSMLNSRMLYLNMKDYYTFLLLFNDTVNFHSLTLSQVMSGIVTLRFPNYSTPWVTEAVPNVVSFTRLDASTTNVVSLGMKLFKIRVLKHVQSAAINRILLQLAFVFQVAIQSTVLKLYIISILNTHKREHGVLSLEE